MTARSKIESGEPENSFAKRRQCNQKKRRHDRRLTEPHRIVKKRKSKRLACLK